MSLERELWHVIEQDFRSRFNLPDWEFRSVPWMEYEFYEELIDIFGSHNVRIISGSRKQEKKGTITRDMIRFSAMISPEGLENLNASTS